eukprot:c9742_g1_i3.p1 GENE.c9742_g1_i3~~c9742_g1_i3.p1  ORF type:complete len:184 (+),score=27.42 c9742_g1_i3:429-980(+)
MCVWSMKSLIVTDLAIHTGSDLRLYEVSTGCTFYNENGMRCSFHKREARKKDPETLSSTHSHIFSFVPFHPSACKNVTQCDWFQGQCWRYMALEDKVNTRFEACASLFGMVMVVNIILLGLLFLWRESFITPLLSVAGDAYVSFPTSRAVSARVSKNIGDDFKSAATSDQYVPPSTGFVANEI